MDGSRGTLKGMKYYDKDREVPINPTDLGGIGWTIAYYAYVGFVVSTVLAELGFIGYLIYKVINL